MASNASEILKSILDRSGAADDVKATAWDAVSASTDSEDFQKRFAHVNLSDDIKADLWDARFDPGKAELKHAASKVTVPDALKPGVGLPGVPGARLPEEITPRMDRDGKPIVARDRTPVQRAHEELGRPPEQFRGKETPEVTEALETFRNSGTPGRRTGQSLGGPKLPPSVAAGQQQQAIRRSGTPAPNYVEPEPMQVKRGLERGIMQTMFDMPGHAFSDVPDLMGATDPEVSEISQRFGINDQEARELIRQSRQKLFDATFGKQPDTTAGQIAEATGSALAYAVPGAMSPMNRAPMFLLSGAMGAQEAADRANQVPHSDFTVGDKAALLGGGILLGLTDVIPWEHWASRLKKVGGIVDKGASAAVATDELVSALYPTLREYASRPIKQALEEGGQELGQSLGQDLLQVQTGTKDPNEIGQTIADEFIGGAGVGALMETVSLLIGTRVGRARLRAAGIDPEALKKLVDQEKAKAEKGEAPTSEKAKERVDRVKRTRQQRQQGAEQQSAAPPASEPEPFAPVEGEIPATATPAAPAVDQVAVPEAAATPALAATPAAANQEQPKPEPASAKLPRELAGAAPRYSYGSKGFTLVFANDVDKASYITAQDKRSKRDADYLQFAMNATGLDEAGVRARGAAIRDRIKLMAKDAKPGSLKVDAHVDSPKAAPGKETAENLPPSVVGERILTTEVPDAPAQEPTIAQPPAEMKVEPIEPGSLTDGAKFGDYTLKAVTVGKKSAFEVQNPDGTVAYKGFPDAVEKFLREKQATPQAAPQVQSPAPSKREEVVQPKPEAASGEAGDQYDDEEDESYKPKVGDKVYSRVPKTDVMVAGVVKSIDGNSVSVEVQGAEGGKADQRKPYQKGSTASFQVNDVRRNESPQERWDRERAEIQATDPSKADPEKYAIALRRFEDYGSPTKRTIEDDDDPDGKPGEEVTSPGTMNRRFFETYVMTGLGTPKQKRAIYAKLISDGILEPVDSPGKEFIVHQDKIPAETEEQSYQKALDYLKQPKHPEMSMHEMQWAAAVSKPNREKVFKRLIDEGWISPKADGKFDGHTILKYPEGARVVEYNPMPKTKGVEAEYRIDRTEDGKKYTFTGWKGIYPNKEGSNRGVGGGDSEEFDTPEQARAAALAGIEEWAARQAVDDLYKPGADKIIAWVRSQRNNPTPVGGARTQAKAEPAKSPESKKAEPKQTSFEFDSTQVNLPEGVAAKVRAFAAKIPDMELAADGREDQPHITVLYGLNDPNALEQIQEVMKGRPHITAKLGKVAMFPATKTNPYDVLMFKVESDGLAELNTEFSKIPNENKYPQYNPHVTIAYLKPGEGKKYVGRIVPGVTGKAISFDEISFMPRDGKPVTINIDGEAKGDKLAAKPAEKSAEPTVKTTKATIIPTRQGVKAVKTEESTQPLKEQDADEPIINAHNQRMRDYHLKEVKNSPWWQTASESQREEATKKANAEDFSAGARKTIDRIRQKDIAGLLSTLHTGNPSSRKIFEEITGLSLPKNEKGTEAVIREYVGPKAFDQFIADRDAAIEKRKADEKAEAEQKKRDEALNEKVRDKDGNVMTYRELIDKRIGEGYTLLEETKRGKFPVMFLHNPEGRGIELRKKALIEYARQQVENLPPKAEEPESPEDQAVKELFTQPTTPSAKTGQNNPAWDAFKAEADKSNWAVSGPPMISTLAARFNISQKMAQEFWDRYAREAAAAGKNGAPQKDRFRTHYDTYEDARDAAQQRANEHNADVAIRKASQFDKPGYTVRFASRNDSDYATAEIVSPGPMTARPSADRFEELHREISEIERNPVYKEDTREGMQLRDRVVDLRRELEFHRPAAEAKAQAEIDAAKPVNEVSSKMVRNAATRVRDSIAAIARAKAANISAESSIDELRRQLVSARGYLDTTDAGASRMEELRASIAAGEMTLAEIENAPSSANTSRPSDIAQWKPISERDVLVATGARLKNHIEGLKAAGAVYDSGNDLWVFPNTGTWSKHIVAVSPRDIGFRVMRPEEFDKADFPNKRSTKAPRPGDRVSVNLHSGQGGATGTVESTTFDGKRYTVKLDEGTTREVDRRDVSPTSTPAPEPKTATTEPTPATATPAAAPAAQDQASILKRVADRLAKEAEESEQALKDMGFYDSLNIGIRPEAIPHLIKIGANYMAQGAVSMNRWMKAMGERFSKLEKADLEFLYHKALAMFEGMIEEATGNTAAQTETSTESAAAPESTETGEPAAEEPNAEKESPLHPKMEKLVNGIRTRLLNGNGFENGIALQKYAAGIMGGSISDGTFEMKDLYDAVETAVNEIIVRKGGEWLAEDPASVVKQLDDLMALLPTQTARNQEQLTHQQFSTPPTLSYLAAKAANIQVDDEVLEPSAGTGSLAAWARAAGGEVTVNELSDRRRGLLDMQGTYKKATGHNAERIADMLPNVKPDVVIMNPPFSASAGRLARNSNSIGYAHVTSALRSLKPGGRLVAILGEGARMDAPNAAKFWSDIAKQGATVRANIGMNGENYRKYGTTFGNRLIVVDKVPSQGAAPITGDFDTILEGYAAIEPILGRSESGAGAEPVGGSAGRPTAVPSGEPRSGAGGSGIARPGVQPGRTDSPAGGTGSEGSAAPAARATSGGRGRSTSGGSKQAPSAPSAPRSASGPVGELELQTGKAAPVSDGVTGTYQTYQPAKLRTGISHLQATGTGLVETGNMAAVEPPDITYRPSLPKSIIDAGKLSDAQLEAVTYAGQAHETVLPSGKRAGFMIGDGTGVGKGSEAAGIVLDNWNKGRKKILWVSLKSDLIKQAQRDLDWVESGIQAKMANDWGFGDQINHEGVVYASYSLLIQKSKTDQTAPTRIQQIINWKPDVIILDESHAAKNAIGTEIYQEDEGGSRNDFMSSEGTAAGAAVIELDQQLPNSRVVYMSATGFTSARNMGYASRLGLWGPGTQFPKFLDFLVEIERGGLGAMELVAREMKAQGRYLARQISFEGVEFREVPANLTPAQREMYDAGVNAWQVILNNIDKAIDVLVGDDDNKARGALRARALSRFWAENQRFYRQLLVTMKVPTVIREIDKALDEGKSVFIDLVSTSEAESQRQMSKAVAENTDFADMDLSAKQMIKSFIDKAFPIYLMEDYKDPETGAIKSRYVTDDKGQPVESAEAKAIRDSMRADLDRIQLPKAPLDELIDYFGADQVAEITGRKSRIVEDPNTGKPVEQIRSKPKGASAKDVNDWERQNFMTGKKRIAIVSAAGGTGFDFHSDKRQPNQQRRVHITIEPSWSADQQMQKFGRTHRTNQAVPPEYILIATDMGGEKRFISAIASRLASLGALTRGERKAGGAAEVLDKYNLESSYGQSAVDAVLEQLASPVVSAIMSGEVAVPLPPLPQQIQQEIGRQRLQELLGLRRVGSDEQAARTLPVGTFLNRVLNLPSNIQALTFDHLMNVFETVVNRVKEAGTFDEGTIKLKALSSRVKSDTVIRQNEAGVPTRHVVVEATLPVKWFPSSDAIAHITGGSVYDSRKGIYRNKRSGQLWAVRRASQDEFDQASGKMIATASGMNMKGNMKTFPMSDIDSGAYELSDRQAWDREYDNAPKTENEDVHIIAGSVLGVWKTLSQGGRVDVVSISGPDGEPITGIKLDPKHAADIVAMLSGNASYSARSIFDRVWDQGTPVELTGAKLAKTRMMGDTVFTIQAASPDGIRKLRELGLKSMSTAAGERFIIPVPQNRTEAQEDQIIAELDRVLQVFPPKTTAPAVESVPAQAAPDPEVQERNRVLADRTSKIPVTKGPVTIPKFPGVEDQKAIRDALRPLSELPTKPTSEVWNGNLTDSADPSALLTDGHMLIDPQYVKNPEIVQQLRRGGGASVEESKVEKVFKDAVDAAFVDMHPIGFAQVQAHDADGPLDAAYFTTKAGNVVTLDGDKVGLLQAAVGVDEYRVMFGGDKKPAVFTDKSGEKVYGVIMPINMDKRMTPFDAEKEPVRFAREAPGFYSQLQRVADAKLPNKAAPAQIIAILRNPQNGVKADELKWTGVEQWLLEQKGPVTKQQVADFLKSNEVRVEEVKKGKFEDGTISEIEGGRHELVFRDGTRYFTRSPQPGERIDGTVTLPHESVLEIPGDQPKMFPNENRAVEWMRNTISWNTKDTSKYGQYTLPGGQNYRELLLTLPTDLNQEHKAKSQILETYIARRDKLKSQVDEITLAQLNDTLPDGWRVEEPSGPAEGWGTLGTEWRVFRGDAFLADGTSRESAIADALRREKIDLNRQIRNTETQIDMAAKDSTQKTGYRSPHWEESNILAHIRFDNRTGPNGERVLHVAELQSDWGQTGRKKGFKPLLTAADQAQFDREFEAARQRYASLVDRVSDLKSEIEGNPYNRDSSRTPYKDQYVKSKAELNQAVGEMNAAQRELEQIRDKKNPSGVPAMPFEKSWHELAFKRVLRYAAENGYDTLSWDTGSTNAERYDLSKHIAGVQYSPHSKVLAAWGKDGEDVLRERVEPERLDDYLGKEVARKLLEQPTEKGEDDPLDGYHVLEGLDLKTPSPGMTGFYDKILPAFANKYLKKWGGKVETGAVVRAPSADEKFTIMRSGDGQFEIVPWVQDPTEPNVGMWGVSSPVAAFDTKQQAENYIKEKTYTVPVHRVDITPAMRESVMQGQPLFAQDNSMHGTQTEEPTAKFSRGGILWVNPAGMQAILSAMGQKVEGSSVAAGIHIPRLKAMSLLVKPSLKSLRPEIKAAFAAGGPITVVRRRPGDSLAKSKELARHELFHATEKWGGDWRADELLMNPIAVKAAGALEKLGYDGAETAVMFSEIGAHLASGPIGWEKMGLSREEAKELFRTYIGLLDIEHIERLKNIAPQLREELNVAKRFANSVRAELDARGGEEGGDVEEGSGEGDLRSSLRRDVPAGSEPERLARQNGQIARKDEALRTLQLAGRSATRFGTVVRDFVAPAEALIEYAGPQGKAIRRLIFETFNKGEVDAGKRLARLVNAEMGKLSKEERFDLVDLLTGHSNEATDKVWDAHDVIRNILNEIGFQARDIGLMVNFEMRVAPGDDIPEYVTLTEKQLERLEKGMAVRVRGKRPFFPREDYVPQSVPDVERLKAGTVRGDIITNLVRRKIMPDEATAAAFIDSYVKFIEDGGRQKALEDYLIQSGQVKSKSRVEARQMLKRYRENKLTKSYGPLEYARDVNFPLWDPDMSRVIPNYIQRASLRLAQIDMLGQSGERLNKMIDRMKLEGPDHDRLKEIVAQIVGPASHNSEEAWALSFVRGVESITKLGPRSTFSNAVQGALNSLLRGDARAAVYGVRAAFTQKGREFALQSGATLESIVQEMMAQGGKTSNDFLSESLGMYLTGVGFSAAERANRIISANAGADYTQRMLNKLMKGKERMYKGDSKAVRTMETAFRDPEMQRIRKSLDELGLDVDTVLARGGRMTPDELLTVAKVFSDLTNFRSRPQDVPVLASTPTGKVFFQFKNYVYGQTRLLKSVIWDEMAAGRVAGPLRALLILGSVFPIAGAALNAVIRMVWGGADRDDESAIEEYFDDMARVGAGGALADLAEASHYDHGVMKWLAGPTVTDATDLIQAGLAAATGKPPKSQAVVREAIRHTPVIGPTIGPAINPKNERQTPQWPKWMGGN